MSEGDMVLAAISQHDALWVLIVLAIVAVALYIVGRR